MAGRCPLRSAKLEPAWGLGDPFAGGIGPARHVFPIFQDPPVLSGLLHGRQCVRRPSANCVHG